MADSFRTRDGVSIAYAVDDYTDPWTRPATLILIHSVMSSLRHYYALTPLLARHLRVVRMDLRGHGDSSEPPAGGALSLGRLGEDVIELMDHLGIERAHLAGAGNGGAVAFAAAVAHPARARSLILLSSGLGMKMNTAPAVTEDWLTRIRRDGMRGYMRATLDFRVPVEASDPAFIDWLLDEAERNYPEFLARLLPVLTAMDLAGDLKKVACPTLQLVSGDTGHMAYKAIAAAIPDIKSVYYEGVRQKLYHLIPERVAADLLAFLAERFGPDFTAATPIKPAA